MSLVVYLCEYGTIYGGENSMLSGLQAMQGCGYDVAVVCPGESPLAQQLAKLGVLHLPFTWTDHEGRRKPLEQLREQLATAVVAWKADIVHANSLSVSRILGPVLRPHGTRFVGHLRDIIKLNRRVVQDISSLDEIYCVSDATRSFHLNQGLTEENSLVLHNGIDLAEFAPPDARNERSTLQAVYIGQLVMRKGIDVLLEGVRLAIEAGADVTLDLYGECHSSKEEARQYLANAELFVDHWKLSDRIRFRGRTDHARQILQKADILVHAARQEPWGRVLLEAGACGLPIIATDVGGTREMYPHGEASLVPVDNPEAIGEAIGKLCRSRELRLSMGMQARNRIEQFDINDYANKLASRYRKVLRGTVK
ncbi:glycosyltransferase family 4 protein [Bremerella alba]|uniref:D-inositol-3-phosphate glycosyltransferase n=1 Tax=Bremerella alba TaxID=980252 RepID=A0A7V9A7N4_9BACT|nr:glycosyltransferase family 4 protein [Bremerella alba]MBA2115206.1 D-inositol-3-phosphate glycosyltransferase [Bremerella alba]